MVAMTKCVKTFEVIFNDPSKTFYCSGDKVSGKIVVEVTQVTRVSSMRVLGVGCARVHYSKGKQRCRQETDYLKYEDVVFLDDQPIGKSGQYLTPANIFSSIFTSKIIHISHRPITLRRVALRSQQSCSRPSCLVCLSERLNPQNLRHCLLTRPTK